MPVKIVGSKGSAMFIHIPKTGGTTVTKWIWKHDRQRLFTINGYKVGHIPTKYVDHPFKFGFIREPLEWWESVFKMLQWLPPKELREGFQPLAVLQPLMEEKFSDFIDNVIRRVPGYYSEVLEMYCKELHFVGRTSHLETDFMRVLDMIGFKYEPRTVKGWQKWGVRVGETVWTDDQRFEVLRLESGWERWLKLS